MAKKAKAQKVLGYCATCDGPVRRGQEGAGLALAHRTWEGCANALSSAQVAPRERTTWAWASAMLDYEGAYE